MGLIRGCFVSIYWSSIGCYHGFKRVLEGLTSSSTEAPLLTTENSSLNADSAHANEGTFQRDVIAHALTHLLSQSPFVLIVVVLYRHTLGHTCMP